MIVIPTRPCCLRIPWTRQCTFIPDDIKENYLRLKNSKGVSRGRKQYWVSSALRKGLCNGENGIVLEGGN